MGHSFRICKQPTKEEEGGEGGEGAENYGGFGGDAGGGGGSGGGWDKPGATTGSGQPEWESNNAGTSTFGGEAPVMVVGGGW